uniref:Sphingosine-1-phosphate phosphatase 2-like n=1 Tax=Phallusia mammillata TaxID=59560 RepID=A0A6F9DS83_9ASCI|nr:sphingosine-1-phosphate phosphatase 2-like [Phallusia mammillata]
MALRSGTLSIQSDDCDKQKSCDMEVNPTSDRYVHAPIDKFGPLGRWFRHKLLDGILVGTPVLLTIQRHRTKPRTTLMKTLSFLGTEDFYTILFLFLMWSVDSRFGRLFGILMFIGFYTTGFLKTMLCLPRPPCPPIEPLEKAFDWALPSHHSLLGVIMPWYIWLYVTLHYELNTWAMSMVCTLIVVWSFGVLLSRLYLGVHSPADIVCGGIVGVLVLSLWMQADDYVDFYVSQQRLEPQLKLLAGMFFLLCIHPITEKGNPSFTDTCILFGVTTGVILARSQRSRFLGMQAVLEVHPDTPVLWFAFTAVARLVVGGIIINVLRVTLRVLLNAIFTFLYRSAGFTVYSSSKYRKTMPPNPKHYTKEFKLPPIHATKTKHAEDEPEETNATSSGDDVKKSEMTSSKSDEPVNVECPSWLGYIQIWNTVFSLTRKNDQQPWDIDVPAKCILYAIITFVGVEVVPRLFTVIGI